jgi:hypothetical protein
MNRFAQAAAFTYDVILCEAIDKRAYGVKSLQ